MVMTWTKSGDKKAISNVLPRRRSSYFLKKFVFSKNTNPQNSYAYKTKIYNPKGKRKSNKIKDA